MYDASDVTPSLGPGTSATCIDLRSDTVTKCTPKMLDALASLRREDMGDDVYGEDPSVNELQRLACSITGKEAALFVPTGTMGNLVSILAHCGRGQDLLLGDDAHIFHYEAGGVSALGGVSMYPLPTLPNGEIPLEALNEAFGNRPIDQHAAPIGCLSIESTHNRKGGKVLSLAYMKEVQSWAATRHIPVHLDGARVFNAAEALGVQVAEIMEFVTSATFCLSKGLGAPAGSIIVGTRDFIRKAHNLRKQLGGGLRQAGVLAVPGLIALKESPKQLCKDHRNAKAFATAIAAIPGVELQPEEVHSNIVIWKLSMDAPSRSVVIERLQQSGVLTCAFKGGIRAVWHLDLAEEHVQVAADAVRSALLNKS